MKAVITFAAGFLLGSIVLPGLHYAFHGDIDPFSHGWPFLLQIGAFVSALVAATFFRQPIAAAVGIFAGLAAIMLISGASPYPVASLLAIAIHAFIPAMMGAAAAFVMTPRQRSRGSGMEGTLFVDRTENRPRT